MLCCAKLNNLCFASGSFFERSLFHIFAWFIFCSFDRFFFNWAEPQFAAGMVTSKGEYFDQQITSSGFFKVGGLL